MQLLVFNTERVALFSSGVMDVFSPGEAVHMPSMDMQLMGAVDVAAEALPLLATFPKVSGLLSEALFSFSFAFVLERVVDCSRLHGLIFIL